MNRNFVIQHNLRKNNSPDHKITGSGCSFNRSQMRYLRNGQIKPGQIPPGCCSPAESSYWTKQTINDATLESDVMMSEHWIISFVEAQRITDYRSARSTSSDESEDRNAVSCQNSHVLSNSSRISRWSPQAAVPPLRRNNFKWRNNVNSCAIIIDIISDVE